MEVRARGREGEKDRERVRGRVREKLLLSQVYC